LEYAVLPTGNDYDSPGYVFMVCQWLFIVNNAIM